MNDIDDLTKQVERKAKAGELTQLERDLFNALLRALNKKATP